MVLRVEFRGIWFLLFGIGIDDDSDFSGVLDPVHLFIYTDRTKVSMVHATTDTVYEVR